MRIDGESTTRDELLTTREEQRALEERAKITERLLKNKSVYILLDGEILKINWIRIKHTDGRFLTYFERDESVQTRECQYRELGIKWGFTEDGIKK